jgi:hypothetical protein
MRMMRYQQKSKKSALHDFCPLSTGIFPDRLKYSEIKLLSTKGDNASISTYRPFPYLPLFLKLLKILYTKDYTII